MDRELRRRLAVGIGVGALFVLVGYVVLAFAAVVVVSVFLYYAVRPIFRRLARLGLGRRARALLSLVAVGVPLLVLLAYAVAIVAIELQSFLDGELSDQVAAELNVGGLDLGAVEESLTNGSEVSADAILDTVLGAAGTASNALVQLLLVLIVTYYLLVDGPQLVAWLLDTYDDPGVGRRYVDAVDEELSVALFGNIVNVFVTAIIGIAVFLSYNALVDPAIAVPRPGLLGALAGIGSLVPIVGIKLVYVPLTVGLGATAWLSDDPELLGPVVVLFLVSAVLVDFVPDFVIRALVSSDQTHTGLLVLAYIVGPSVFGFFGLFLAPILLVCTTNAVTVLMPYVVTGESAVGRQTRLGRFGD